MRGHFSGWRRVVDCGPLGGREEDMKKALCKWAALCLAAAVLGGCGSDGDRETKLEDMRTSLSDGQENGEQESRPSEEKEESPAGIQESGGEDAPVLSLTPEEEAMYKAYITVLEDIYFDGKFPGSGYCGDLSGDYDMADNQFAVYDIDFDGRQELLISYTATYTAGMVAMVYDYDNSAGDVREELAAYPYLSFYDNGVVEEQASHNQGMASDGGPDGDFWPYSLRRYDAETDAYVPVGMVDAWSRGYREEDYDGNPFPEEADVDGDGMVYYVMEGDYALVNPMDGAEYNQWRDQYLKGTEQIQIPYVNLTTDNIYSIGNGIGIGNGISNGKSDGASSGGEAAPESLAGKQISEQSFTAALDGWGEVTFAPFEPERAMEDGRGQACFGDVRFELLKEGKSVFSLPGENEDNVFYGQQFKQVLSVAFRDYNEDGRTDILVLLEYAGVQGQSADASFRTVRAYFQEEGTKDFTLDRPLSEYLRSYADSMEKVYEGLDSYESIYSVATDKSAWEVESFARKVKRQLLAGDFEGLCGAIEFPITIDGAVYQDKEAFLEADFIKSVNPAFLEGLQAEPCGNMFVNYQGIMLGEGCVWISDILDENQVSRGLKVYGMNGLSANVRP